MGPLRYPKISGHADAAVDPISRPDHAHPWYATRRWLRESGNYAGARVGIDRAERSHYRRRPAGPELGRPAVETAGFHNWDADRIARGIRSCTRIPKRRGGFRPGARRVPGSAL